MIDPAATPSESDVAIVTGGAGGIGEAAARALARRGLRVAVADMRPAAAEESATRLRAGDKLELGRDIPSSWLVGPPFGRVLVTAVSSPVPLGALADRPPFELASAYLLRLREALAAGKGSERLIADFVFLETVAR